MSNQSKQVKIDASKRKVGRLASDIAIILQGKDEPSYDPRLPGEKIVIVDNVENMDISNKKMDQKMYYRHSTYVGNLKQESLRKKMEKDPGWVLRHAVYLMLPKNKLRKQRMKRLVVNQNQKSEPKKDKVVEKA